MGKKRSNKRKYDTNLPIYWYKTRILEKIKTNAVVIITGQTGCGKSTQIPKYLLESGYGKNGIIACLHPRCVAAQSLAERVSVELNDVVGGLVGYQIRFFKELSEKTRILFMSTGLMLQIMKNENFYGEYSIVIIDEAHERSIQADVVMGKMKEVLKLTNHVKLIVMSATLNVDQIRNYYENSAVINIANTKDDVKVIYRPLKSQNYVDAIRVIVEEILKTTKKGHILIFLQSEDKVYKCRKLLKKLKGTKLLPFFASLDMDEKMMVFMDYPNRRKIIIATNVAETSLTIPGVDFVIDSGLVKRVRYDHETGVEKWITESVSIAEANQRKGRVGRTGIGTCYRLYDEKCVAPIAIDDLLDTFDLSNILDSLPVYDCLPEIPVLNKIKPVQRFQDYPEPEIQTMNLCSIVLTLKAMNKIDIMRFPFIVPPDEKNVNRCIEQLKDLSLLHDNTMLTNLGKQVSNLPLEPRLGKVAIVGSQLACRKNVIAIIAMLTVRNVLRTTGQNFTVYKAYAENHGDLFMLNNIFFDGMSNHFTKRWCKEKFVNFSCMKYSIRVYEQLDWILPQPYANGNYLRNGYNDNLVKKVFLAGYFNNVAKKSDISKYLTLSDEKVQPNRQSSVSGEEEM